MRYSSPTSWRLVGLLFILLSNAAYAQNREQLPAFAKLDECYRVVGKDSVVFFYSLEYKLTPPGCAAIRRHVRLDSAGRFFGYVRDYQLSNNQLLLQGTYRAGKLEGQLELYHPTGELAARGRYIQGQQVGDWGYWYASGSRRQVLSFRNGQYPLIQQFWDEAGQQTVTNGTGTWYRDEDGMRLQGAVVGGVQDGKWFLRSRQDETVVAREVFAKGRFRNGVIINQVEYYQDQPRLSVNDWQGYLMADEYKLSLACSGTN